MKSKRNSYTAGVSYLSLFYGVLPNSIPLGDFRSEDQWWRSGPRLSDVIFALTPNGAEASKRRLSPPAQRRVIMNKFLIATIALVTVFSTPASAMPGPGSPRGFATFQTYRGIRTRTPSIIS